MTPQQLRNSILQMAIEGKLTEQRAEDGNAADLLKEIKAEKVRLVAKKKIKKEKPLPEISEDEIPFEIPENWVWTRFGQLVINRDSERIPLSVSQREILEKKYNYYGASGVIDKVDKYIFDKTLLLIGEDGANLLSRSTPIAYLAHGKYWVNNHAHVLDCINEILMNYIMQYINAISLAPYVTGTAQPKMNQAKMNGIIVPLPPLAEQKRIVARLKEILPQVDEYEKAYNELQELNKKFPDNLKNSLLQMAIEGKLVEQRAEDGNAADLLKGIKAEKTRLIKEKKIKKEKPLPEISEDEIPFEIPDNWCWAYVGDLFMHNTGKAMNSSAKKVNKAGSIRKFITTSNVYWNKFELTNVKEMFFSDDELDRCTITKGDILICEGGAYYGRTAIWDNEYDICFQNHVHRLRKYKKLINMFFYYIFYFYRNNGLMQSKGTAMPGLSSVVLHNTIVPLPPVAEQKRIVAKLEQLMPLCDELSKEYK